MTSLIRKSLLWVIPFFLPLTLLAADSGFVPLVGIPYVDTASDSTSVGDYVNSLYWASISIAAVLAVLKIIFAGVKYMLSEIVTDKSAAKKDIQGALLGLVLIISAVLILDTINPNLSQLTALNLEPLGVGVGGHGGIDNDPCQLWAISTSTGQRECRANESDTDNTNLDELLEPGSTSGKLVLTITEEEQRASINEDYLIYNKLLETSKAQAAATCGVNIDEVNEVIPMGFVGVFYYCPTVES